MKKWFHPILNPTVSRQTSRHTSAIRASFRPLLHALEDRVTPATIFVNDDWFIVDDVDSSGDLSNGDIVDGRNDDLGSITGTFGVDAFATIEDALAVANDDDEVIVLDGSYVENIVINQNISLLSVNGRESTTIEGITGTATGTVRIEGTTDGVQVGAVGQGFHIIGIDGPTSAIEAGAVYISGTHTNLTIVGNEIEAAGDHGLIAEFAANIDGAIITNNIFSGTTFIPPNPAGDGFGAQGVVA